MGLPVLIAARNEESQIGKTLEVLSLQTQTVEPIVIVNASTDNTADIAKNCGAIVLESEEGKLPDLQTAWRYLGKRALEPLLILDADCHPLSSRWSQHLANVIDKLPKQNPSMVWAPYIFKDDINPA